MFTMAELEILQRANREAYRLTKRRAKFVERESDDYDESALYQAYLKEMGEYLEVKISIDKAIKSIK